MEWLIRADYLDAAQCEVCVLYVFEFLMVMVTLRCECSFG